MTKTQTGQPLIDSYLNRLAVEAKRLPKQQRRELLTDIEAHLRVAAQETGASEVQIRTLLTDFGSPADIVNAAGPLRRQWAAPIDVVTIVLLLIGGLIIPVFGWVIGVTLLWRSTTWTPRLKKAATLLWPGGLLGVGIFWILIRVVGTHNTTCSGISFEITPNGVRTSGTNHCVHTVSGLGIPNWLDMAIIAVAIAVPVAVAAVLYVSAVQRHRDGLVGA